MASIGALIVDLIAKTGTFETDLGRAASAAKKRSAEIDKEFAKIGKAVAATGVAAATGVHLSAREFHERYCESMR